LRSEHPPIIAGGPSGILGKGSAYPIITPSIPTGFIPLDGKSPYDLEQLLGRRVDVVTERGLKPRIRERVLREAVPL
jgi:hypothetical protein